MLSEKDVVAALESFLDAVEAGIASAREIMKGQGGSEWNPDKIMWVYTQSSKGRYERADPQEASDYALLKKDLNEHGGFMEKNGFRYWMFDQKDAIGRRKVPQG